MGCHLGTRQGVSLRVGERVRRLSDGQDATFVTVKLCLHLDLLLPVPGKPLTQVGFARGTVSLIFQHSYVSSFLKSS